MAYIFGICSQKIAVFPSCCDELEPVWNSKKWTETDRNRQKLTEMDKKGPKQTDTD